MKEMKIQWADNRLLTSQRPFSYYKKRSSDNLALFDVKYQVIMVNTKKKGGPITFPQLK